MDDGLDRRRAEVDLQDSNALVQLGCDFADVGREVEAEECFRRAVDLGEEWVTFNLGNSLSAVGRYAEAIKLYERALAVGETDAWLNMGNALRDLGDLAGAVHAYEQGRRVGDVNAGMAWAYLLRELDHRDRAEEIVGELEAEGSPLAAAVSACWRWDRTHDPALEGELRAGAELFAETRCNLGLLLHEAGRIDEAIAVLRRGIGLDEVESFLPLANIYYDDLDQVQAAKDLYLAGIEAGDDWCHHNLAVMLEEQGNMEEALWHYRLGAAEGDQLAIKALRAFEADDE